MWIWININLLKVIQRCFRITCHKHQISHFEEYRNKSYYCSCNILYPWYPKRQENLIVIWMQMLLMVKTSYKVKSLLPNHMSVVNRFLRFWIEFIYSICIIHNTSKNSLYVLESKWIEMWTILSFIDFSSEWTSPEKPISYLILDWLHPCLVVIKSRLWIEVRQYKNSVNNFLYIFHCNESLQELVVLQMSYIGKIL